MTADELTVPVQVDGKGADIVPPSLDQAREFARRSKAMAGAMTATATKGWTR